jgi:hypothetical protein
MAATNKTSREGGIVTRATELTTVLYVTQEGVDAKAAVFTVSREPKSDSTLNQGANTGKGCDRKRTKEETTRKANNYKGRSSAGIAGGKGEDSRGFQKGPH